MIGRGGLDYFFSINTFDYDKRHKPSPQNMYIQNLTEMPRPSNLALRPPLPYS